MKRPRPVTILAVLIFLLGFSNLVTAILLISGKVTFETVFNQVPDLGDMQVDFEQTMKVLILLFGALGIAVAAGLLGMRNWARVTTRVFGVLGLLGALIQMIQAFTARNALNFLYCALIGGAYYAAFFYLGQAQVRAAFAPQPPSAPPEQPSLPPGSDSAG